MNYEFEIQEIKKQLNNLQNSFLQAQRNQVPITNKVDNATNKLPQVDDNTEGITENSDGIFDIASLADENSQAIMDLAEIVAEMEGNNG